MSIKVIGAGFGRTGTKSLQLALEKLGYDKCYHMDELTLNPQGVGYWERADKGEDIDWDQLFKGYQSIVDFPGSIHCKKLAAHYPEAKVILTVRDPEKWYNSARSTIFSFNPGILLKLRLLASLPFSSTARYLFRVIKLIKRSIWKGFFQGQFLDKEFAINHFNEHTDKVQSQISEDRLLVFEVKEGWEPLCRFLNKDIPDEPFPMSNQKEGFETGARNMVREVLNR